MSYSGIVLENYQNKRLLIQHKSGDDELIANKIGPFMGPNEYIEPGYVVEIETRSIDEEATYVLSRNGYSNGNLPGRVEKVEKDSLHVRTDTGVIVVSKPDENIERGFTVELTHALTFRKVTDRNVDNTGYLANQGSDNASPDYSQSLSTESFDQIGGLKEIKKSLTERVIQPIKRIDVRKALDLSSTRGVLFYGEPGTGKTITAKALANELGGQFYPIKGPELVSKYYGETEREIREVFSQAKDSATKSEPSTIFFDELDSVAPPRSDADETERRIVAQLLSEMDGIEDVENVVVVGTTNIIDGIDQAILRPGRLDEKIEFEPPGIDGRTEILESHVGRANTKPSVNYYEIAEKTQGLTGADLEEVVIQAKYVALNSEREYLSQEDLRIALSRLKD